MANFECRHLGATTTAGRRHREAHLVVDIHEGEWTGRIGTGATDIGAFGPERREFITNATASFQREASLVHLIQDIVHGVVHRIGHSAVDGGRGWLVVLRTSIRDDAASRDRAVAQRIQEALVPQFTLCGAELDACQRFRDAAVSRVDVFIDGLAVFGLQAILLVPNVQGSRLT